MRKILFILILLFPLQVFSQQSDNSDGDEDQNLSDTAFVADDYTYNEYSDKSSSDTFAANDSLVVEHRKFSNKTVQELKEDTDLQYKEPPTVVESLWDRFLQWLNYFIESLFNNAVTTNWGRVFAYALGLIVIVAVIMMILKVNAFRIFYGSEGAKTINYSLLDENIHEINFDKEIQQAVSQQDYRRGVRLVFLYALKILSDEQLIHWQQGKTNHDYVDELQKKDLKVGFNELSFYFDYAWYGNFAVNQELFSKVQHLFNDWKLKVK